HLRARGWRFTLRVKGNWTMSHSEFQGSLDSALHLGRVGIEPQWFVAAVLGDAQRRESKRVRNCAANLVWWRGAGHREPWFLVTSEDSGLLTVQLYRERMRIECGFRDVKGPLGLDQLANWQGEGQVARFLAMMAVYEWRLAYLWLMHRLVDFARRWQVKGKLSWIRTAREWLQHRMRTGSFQPDACL